MAKHAGDVIDGMVAAQSPERRAELQRFLEDLQYDEPQVGWDLRGAAVERMRLNLDEAQRALAWLAQTRADFIPGDTELHEVLSAALRAADIEAERWTWTDKGCPVLHARLVE